jgi:hypothetical protein
MGIGWNIAAVMGVVAAGAGLWGGYQAKKAEAVLRDLDAARAATVAAQADLNNCAARLLNIQEAQADEDHFDAIPDGSLGDDIPAHWLLPSGAGPATDDN